MADSISSLPDAELLSVLAQSITTVAVDPTIYGFTAGNVAVFDSQKDTFDTDLTQHIASQATAKADTQTKEASRVICEEILRNIRRTSKAKGVSEAQMAALGIPAGPSQAAPSNATVPAASVNTSERLRHTLEWRDNATPDNKRKPRGVTGAEIWVKIDGPPPGNEKDCVFLTLDTQTPYLAEYDSTNAGKTAHYMLRWQLKDGTKLAWGETISATITG